VPSLITPFSHLRAFRPGWRGRVPGTAPRAPGIQEDNIPVSSIPGIPMFMHASFRV